MISTCYPLHDLCRNSSRKSFIYTAQTTQQRLARYCHSPLPSKHSEDTDYSHVGMKYSLTCETVWPEGTPTDWWHYQTAGKRQPQYGSGNWVWSLVPAVSLSQSVTSVTQTWHSVRGNNSKTNKNKNWKLPMMKHDPKWENTTDSLHWTISIDSNLILSKHWNVVVVN